LKRDASTATRKAIGHHAVVSSKRKADQKRPVLRLRPESTKQNPSAVIAESLVMPRAASGRNTHKRPQTIAPPKLQECSWMKSYSCATSTSMTHTTSQRT
jgi:hypothetical protein